MSIDQQFEVLLDKLNHLLGLGYSIAVTVGVILGILLSYVVF